MHFRACTELGRHRTREEPRDRLRSDRNAEVNVFRSRPEYREPRYALRTYVYRGPWARQVYMKNIRERESET